ncbi:phosphoglycerate mutase-like protein [Xylariaceae sp. FL0662B]|nr:phosphoglycerate mutase-like protein [Xylariaceae sp. FL0662B]
MQPIQALYHLRNGKIPGTRNPADEADQHDFTNQHSHTLSSPAPPETQRDLIRHSSPLAGPDGSSSSLTPEFVTPGMDHKFEFSSVPGFFESYSGLASSRSFVPTQNDLGIIPRSYDEQDNELAGTIKQSQWSQFANHIKDLNQKHNPHGEYYKLVYVIRHGRGVHNVKMDELKIDKDKLEEDEDGKPKDWNNYWGYEDGDGKGTIWSDAQLVEKGIGQAKDLAKLWDQSNRNALPLPETVYTSPLARGLETTRLVFQNAMGEDFRPIIKDGLKERLTGRPCDRRSPRSWIEENYPNYEFEQGFPELDTNWEIRSSETVEDHEARIQKLFEDIFTYDKSTIISFTTHSYTLTAILKIIKHDDFWLAEGAVAPLFVKAINSDKVATAEEAAPN